MSRSRNPTLLDATLEELFTALKLKLDEKIVPVKCDRPVKKVDKMVDQWAQSLQDHEGKSKKHAEQAKTAITRHLAERKKAGECMYLRDYFDAVRTLEKENAEALKKEKRQKELDKQKEKLARHMDALKDLEHQGEEDYVPSAAKRSREAKAESERKALIASFSQLAPPSEAKSSGSAPMEGVRPSADPNRSPKGPPHQASSGSRPVSSGEPQRGRSRDRSRR